MDLVQNPKGKTVERCSREDMDVDSPSESEEARKFFLTGVEDTLQMLRFYSNTTYLQPSLEQSVDMFKEAAGAIEGLRKLIVEPSKLPKIGLAEESQTMRVLLQEIKEIKATVAKI